MNFGERIKALRQSRGWSQELLAAKAGLNRTTLLRYEAGTIGIPAKTLQQIADALEAPITYLYGLSESQVNLGPWEAIPLLGSIPAGELRFTEETVEGYRMVPKDQVKGGIHFALRVQGECMAPRYRTGYLAIVRVQPEVENGEIAVVVVDNEEATLKRVFYQDNERVILRADNTDYPPILVDARNMRVIGKVVGGAFDEP